ncbi:MAG: anthranilate synthase component I [Syntrophales bacterium]|jgi:anthranilate synthase component 1|nr:anthranilate synthase component I [Syntrophales bacterium]
MYSLTFEQFARIAEPGRLVVLYREILADMETPVTALAKFSKRPYAFLLESVEGGETWGRYTFLGCDPRAVLTITESGIEILKDGRIDSFKHNENPLAFLKAAMERYRPVYTGDLPRFYGGAVGYLGYDMARYFETLPESIPVDPGGNDAVFLLTDTMAVFDRLRNTVKVIASIAVDEGDDLSVLYNKGIDKIEATIALLTAENGEVRSCGREKKGDAGLEAEMTAQDFKDMVGRAKEYIQAGDVIQVVLSQRFRKKADADPVDLYRALRFINPSPYLFYLKLDRHILIGSSPESMVRLEEGTATVRPIAGTRRRGKNEQDDRALANELLNDEKEKAEHIMLVDLGRNDLGRIARTGSVQVTQLMVVERYSHVMHLVSNIEAQLAPGKDAFDVIAATFPAGTLTGAPKVRAMEIIEELEKSRRGIYGGAVGCIGYGGDMDLCITIRTIEVNNGNIYVHAGAGIVADSDPAKEFSETVYKAEAMTEAIRLAAANLRL